MEFDLGLFEVLFYTSLTVNVCILLHFGLFYLMDKLVAEETQTNVTRLRLAHKHNAVFMRNFYLDAILFTVLPIATLVLTFTTGVLDTPFEAYFPNQLRAVFSVVCGSYIFILFRCCMISNSSPIKYVNVIIYVISFATAITVLLSGEDATIGIIVVVSNGDVLFLNLVKLFDILRIQHSKRSHRMVLFSSVYTSLVFRACLPLTCIAVSLINGKPFNMSYPSICFFFVGILFFGAINTWQVNVAISRICCLKSETVIEVPYRQFGNGSEPKPEDIAIAISSMEMPPSYTDVFGDSSFTSTTSASSSQVASSSLSPSSSESSASSADHLTLSPIRGNGCLVIPQLDRNETRNYAHSTELDMEST